MHVKWQMVSYYPCQEARMDAMHCSGYWMSSDLYRTSLTVPMQTLVEWMISCMVFANTYVDGDISWTEKYNMEMNKARDAARRRDYVCTLRFLDMLLSLFFSFDVFLSLDLTLSKANIILQLSTVPHYTCITRIFILVFYIFFFHFFLLFVWLFLIH